MNPWKVVVQNIFHTTHVDAAVGFRHTIELKLKYILPHTAHAQKMADLEEIQLTSGDETDKEVRLKQYQCSNNTIK